MKPGNIILGLDGKLHIVDFGISCKLKVNGRNPGYIGTLGYSAPEQINDNVCDVRSDIYSLGGVLYFLIEGINPPVENQRKYNINTPAYMIDIIEKCMANNPLDRYSNIQELVDALDKVSTLHEITEKQTEKNGPFFKKPAIMCALAVFFLAGILTLLLTLNNKNRVFTDTQFYKETFEDYLKQENKIVISPKHVYFKDSALYMNAFVYNGYDHDIKEIRKIHIVLYSGNDVIADKIFSTTIKNIKSNHLQEYQFIFTGSAIKNSNVDLATIKWDISFIRID